MAQFIKLDASQLIGLRKLFTNSDDDCSHFIANIDFFTQIAHATLLEGDHMAQNY